MEMKMYNSKLRALLSIRNFNTTLEKHYEQMKQIEEDLDSLNKNALSTIETHCSKKEQENWKMSQQEVIDSIESINESLKLLREKIEIKKRTDSVELWNQLNASKNKLKKSYEVSEKLGYEILPASVHKHWEKDICNFEKIIMSLLLSHVEACKLELEMIEKYTPSELDEITRVIASHIPEDFTFEWADKYEKEYLKAVEEMKKEFGKKKNLWDRFLDILADGTHQSPSERVMMQRWVNGDKEDVL
jgi:hypothetical protein